MLAQSSSRGFLFVAELGMLCQGTAQVAPCYKPETIYRMSFSRSQAESLNPTLLTELWAAGHI